MEWLEKMNRAMRYIEENLAAKISYEEIAHRACCSVYQFQRLFSFITDVPLSEYIRRRRLTLAAFDLQNTRMKVIEVALKYGYESPESFARAFQTVHGATPTLARSGNIQLKAYPRMTFHLSIKGDIEMEYRIEKKAEFSVYGVDRVFDMENEMCYAEINGLWNTFCADGTLEKLALSANKKYDGPGEMPIRSVCGYDPLPGTKFRYMFCVEEKPDTNSAGYKNVTIPAGTWAVFTTEDSTAADMGKAVQKLNKNIYGEWLPTSNYKMIGPTQEIYYVKENGKIYCENWVMVEPEKLEP